MTLKRTPYKLSHFVPVLGLFLLACACSGSSMPDPELALQEGAHLTAKNGAAEVQVFAGRKLNRRYQWDDCSLDADMKARSSRWMGSLGMYDPAGRLWLNPLAGCHGISRPVVQEGQMHFADEQSAERWIARYGKSYANVVWTNDGLLVAWDITPARGQLNVDVYQICLRGKRPSRLAGALDGSVNVSGAARRPCVTVSDEVIAKTQADWQGFWHFTDEPAGATAPQSTVTLAYGQPVSIREESLTLELTGVRDSRCPPGGYCAWEGYALVDIQVTKAGSAAQSVTIGTDRSTRAEATYGGYRLNLVNLEPANQLSPSVPLSDYRATIKLSKLQP